MYSSTAAGQAAPIQQLVAMEITKWCQDTAECYVDTDNSISCLMSNVQRCLQSVVVRSAQQAMHLMSVLFTGFVAMRTSEDRCIAAQSA